MAGRGPHFIWSFMPNIISGGKLDIWRSHLADIFQSFGITQTRNTEKIMKEIKSVYLVKDSSNGPPDCYLGNDYKRDKKGQWYIGHKKYLYEAIS
eukprot:12272360-Ditylum_brightwellii.AAC.1